MKPAQLFPSIIRLSNNKWSCLADGSSLAAPKQVCGGSENYLDLTEVLPSVPIRKRHHND
jgi:hypothetical protein